MIPNLALLAKTHPLVPSRVSVFVATSTRRTFALSSSSSPVQKSRTVCYGRVNQTSSCKPNFQFSRFGPDTHRFLSSGVQGAMGATQGKPESGDAAATASAVAAQPSANAVEAVVAKVGDLKDGEMKEVEVGSGKALLVYSGGEYSAIGHKCSHYGAPLIKGSLCNNRVRCPWHGACFNVKTGDIEDFPGLDSVPRFGVRIDGEDVVVIAEPSALANFRRTADMAEPKSDDARVFVIVGGGGAAMSAAESLRQEGFTGRILMFSKEDSLPYDRPKLSKALSSTAEALALRNADFFKQHGIEFAGGKEVVSVDAAASTVTFADGASQSYDKVLFATGGAPRACTCPGADLDGIHLLRTVPDGNTIAASVEGKHLVVVGSSFIGMEVAACLCSKAASVTVVGRSPIPFAAVLGEKIGLGIRKMHEDKGVKFQLGTTVTEFKGEGGHVTSAVLGNGQTLPADIVVCGLGVTPTTSYLKGVDGITFSAHGSVQVDSRMHAAGDIYVAGDIAHFPLPIANGHVTIGHWQLAARLGRAAAQGMLDKTAAGAPLDTVPFFWTQMFGKSLRYAGYGHGHDDIVVEGDPDELKFAAAYLKGDSVIAVAAMGMDPLVSRAADHLLAGTMPSAADVRANPASLLAA
ncbi:apoptosis-inducing factor 3-like [Sycon ciliatum]|uniref:apoptosis-inducing factor 3-like n=1 Tax=Sycon ciliatum TaxID=27933 RepID=UPI0020AEC1C6|eukprot:scpid43698/ scgid26927/ Apoptosis-inducing factor 3; Apoptosis-inducing factor-like protein